MQKITEQNHLASRVARQHHLEALQVTRRSPMRYRLTQGAVGSRLAEVRVGHEQRFAHYREFALGV